MHAGAEWIFPQYFLVGTDMVHHCIAEFLTCPVNFKMFILFRDHFFDMPDRQRVKARRKLLPGTWSHLWFAGVRQCPPWCSIVGATVTVHQFFCILHWYDHIKSGCPSLQRGLSREDDYFTNATSQATWFWSKLPFSVHFQSTFITLNDYQLAIYHFVAKTKKMM